MPPRQPRFKKIAKDRLKLAHDPRIEKAVVDARRARTPVDAPTGATPSGDPVADAALAKTLKGTPLTNNIEGNEREGQQYKTQFVGDDTVRHAYADGKEADFKVDNMAQRRELADVGYDYGQLQRSGGLAAQMEKLAAAKVQLAGGTPAEAPAPQPTQPQPSQAQQVAQFVKQATRGRAQAPGQLKKVDGGRTPAQMREDNPEMVERVKRRMRGR